MLTYRTGAAGAPSAAKAMAAHLLEKTLPAEDMHVAEYYAGGTGTARAVAEEMGCVPTVRADVRPELASALGVSPGEFLDEAAVACLLGGRRADGGELPGQQRDIRRYESKDETKRDRLRISYVDLCLSAPKSVSVAWAFAPTAAERNSILQAHRDARDETLAYVERETGKANFGHARQGGEERGNLAWVTFDHFTSRPTIAVTRPDPKTGVVDTEIHSLRVAGDPQIHSHCIIPNIMATESGRMVAMNRDQLRGRIHEFGAVYQALLARNLRQIGIDVQMDERTKMATLPAIPQRVQDEFSKRTRDAEGAAREEAKARNLDWDGLSPAERIDFLKGGAKETRRFKADDLASEAAWQKQAEGLKWRHRTALAYGPPPPEQPRTDRLEDAYQAALPHLAEDLSKRAVVQGTDARLAAARGLIAAGIGDTDDITALTRTMATRGVQQDGGVTRLIWEGGDRRARISTELHVSQEQELVGLVQGAAANRSAALPPAALDAAAKRSGLDFEGEHGKAQRKAVDALGGGGHFAAAVGVAGSGKSALLGVLVDAWTERGSDVWAVADAWRQARALAGEKGAGIQADRAKALQPFLSQVQDGRITLTPRCVVVLDELGRVGTRQLLHLLRMQQRDGFKIVAVGDDKQTASIEAGAVIGLLRTALGKEAVPEITTTVRQHTAREREIAGLFREGKAAEALTMKRQDGTAEMVPGSYWDAVRRVADLWQERTKANQDRPGYTVTASAPTNADARAISQEIRLRRRAEGLVGQDRARMPAVDQNGATYELPLSEGDRVRLFARTRALFTDERGRRKSAYIGENGSVLEVVRVRPDEGLELRAESGKVGFVPWGGFRAEGSERIRLTYGDCLTIDSSQGITSDEHINAMPSGSRSVQGLKAYVAESRHRVASWMVTSEGAELRAAQDRQPLGAGAEIKAADLWDAMARNLSQQPVKESAMAFAAEVAREQKRTARTLQAGLRTQESREAGGHAPTTLQRTLSLQRAKEVVARIADRLDGAFAALAPLLSRLRPSTPEDQMEGRLAHTSRVYAPQVARGDVTFSEARERMVAREMAAQRKDGQTNPLHGTPRGRFSPDEIESRAEAKLLAAIDRHTQHEEPRQTSEAPRKRARMRM